MKRISYILALIMLVTHQVEAEGTFSSGLGYLLTSSTNMDPYVLTDDVDYIGYLYNKVPAFDLTYTSYDGKKNKVTLAVRVYYPKSSDDKGEINNIFLACHPTVTDNWQAPRGGNPIDFKVGNLAGVADETSIVVFPEYCGYGVSSHLQHPYLIHDVTARNCIDALMAVLKKIKEEKKWNISKAHTHILGYSQGGATALACTKYLESDACPDSVKNEIKLYETACGDGPYSAIATVNKYLEWGYPTKLNGGDDLEYACVLPLIVAAAKDAYGDGCMRTVNVEDYFSDEFLSTGILDLIKTKEASTDVLDKAISGVMKRQRPVDVFSENIIDKNTGKFRTDTKEYKCLMRALELGDLTIGWEPKHPIYIYHLECDKVVPYANKEEIFKEGHIGGAEDSGLVQYITPQEANRIVQPAVVRGKIPNPDNNTSHATGGVIFYGDYMYGYALREVFRKATIVSDEIHRGIGIDRK
ncbi:MAG: hypothetical protein MJZ14_05410 [Paludibacteraceae bacterium]|nr:hypothetical protein [Paludibacteraceae bacterium]